MDRVAPSKNSAQRKRLVEHLFGGEIMRTLSSRDVTDVEGLPLVQAYHRTMSRWRAQTVLLVGLQFAAACSAPTPATDANPTDAVMDAALDPTDAVMDATLDAPPDLAGVVEIAAGGGHTCARRNSGAVVCWGSNGYGQLGDGATHRTCGTWEYPPDCSPSPVEVAGLTDAVEIAAGSVLTCARRTSGAVVCWGGNSSGGIGDGTTGTDRPTPTAVVGLTDAVEIAAGGHACARRASGGVVCWGSNRAGQIGDGTSGTDRLTPVLVMGLTDAVEIAVGGGHSCARRASGAVVCWGDNTYGQIGDGTSGTNRLAPVAVVGLSDAVGLAAGGNHNCARRASGTVVCWGHDSGGRIDGGMDTWRATPWDVASVTDAVEITAGYLYSCVRRASGAVDCWGRNNSGQLGDGTGGPGSHSAINPLAVMGLTDAIGVAAGDEGGNGGHTCAVRAGGNVVCWGRNYYGQIGDGTTTNRMTPVAVWGP